MQLETETSSRKAPEPGNQASRSNFCRLEAPLVGLDWTLELVRVTDLGGGEVELAGDDVDDAIGDGEGLVEGLGVGDHLVEHWPGVAGRREAELLHLLELVDAEDAAGVAPVAPHLLAEAGGEARVAQRQCVLAQPLLPVEGRDGLLRSCDQVLLLLPHRPCLLRALSRHLNPLPFPRHDQAKAELW